MEVMGSLVSRKGPLQDLDVRIKLVGLLAVTAVLFGARNPLVVVGMMGLCAVLCALVPIPPRSLVAALKPALVVVAFVVVANALVLDGTGSYTLFGPVGLTGQGLLRGLWGMLRIFCAIAFALVVAATTGTCALADGFGSFLAPLGRVGVPTDDLAMVLSLCLRFVPLCGEELGRIKDAQDSRGAALGKGGSLRSLGRWTAVLIPLTVALFRRSQAIALAMEDRGFGTGPVTPMMGRLGAAGWLACGTMVILAVGLLLIP